MKNITVGYCGTRGSQVALSQALAVARAIEARLKLVMVQQGDSDDESIAGLKSGGDGDFAVRTADLPAERRLVPNGHPLELDEAAAICSDEGVVSTQVRLYGDPGERLTDLSRLSDLVVIGRRNEYLNLRRPRLGRTARRLCYEGHSAVLLADREHIEIKSATLLYEPHPSGGHALRTAGLFCSLMNITLNVVSCDWGRMRAAQAMEEAQAALRAYHIDGEFASSSELPAEALQSAALQWGDPLIICPGPPRRGFFRDDSTLRAAVASPNTNVLVASW